MRPLFLSPARAHEDLKKQHYAPEVKAAVSELAEQFLGYEWSGPRINEAMKAVIASHKTQDAEDCHAAARDGERQRQSLPSMRR
jgi:hypothetical protein